jgi:hypothetical protein
MSLGVIGTMLPGSLHALIPCALSILAINAQAVETLCRPTEVAVFTCRIARSAKIASLCASEKLTEQEGYVQYRFGTRKKIELEFPEIRQHSAQQFVLDFYIRPMVTRSSISFEVHANRYTLVNNDEDDGGYERHEHGVEVVTAKGKRVWLPCGEGVKADFLHVREVMPCDEQDSAGCAW